MKKIITNNWLRPILSLGNLRAGLNLALKILPWVGLVVCLWFIFLGKSPPVVKALKAGAAPLVPNLTLSVTDTPDPVKIGNVLTYTINVTNDGTAEATHVVVSNKLDDNVSFVSASPDCAHDGQPTDGVVICEVGTLAPNDTATLTLTVTVVSTPASGYLIANSTKAQSDEGAADCDTVTTTVIAPKLEINKSDDPDPVVVGEMLTYTIVVSNVGYAEATGVILTDTLDSNVSFKSASDGGTHDGQATDGLVTWNVGVINPWEIITRTVSVTVANNLTCGSTFPNTVKTMSEEGAGAEDTIDTTLGGGSITINACEDKDADGACGPGGELPPGVSACLTDGEDAPVGACQPVTAEFLVAPGSYTAHLEFSGDSQGYYPTLLSETVEVNQCDVAEIMLSAVEPIHPKGIAVHGTTNKVYVAFQGADEGKTWPYPFVAVIDNDTDRVMHTIPGGDDGIGRQPWGTAVSGDGQYVYVGSFGDGQISVIDPANDTVIENIRPAGDFSPTTAAVNPATGQVHFVDYKGGRMIILEGTSIAQEVRIDIPPASFSPFEIAVADAGPQGYSYITMRGALQPNLFRFATLNNDTLELNHPTIQGPPHAIGVWQQGGEGRLFITYADDPRPTDEPFPNPNKLAVYSFSTSQPKDVLQRRAEIVVGDYAEAGLVYDPISDQMLGTYGGFAYDGSRSDEEVCGSGERGGTYTLDFEGNVGSGFAPNMVVGNPPLTAATTFDWKNPFEIAVNPTNNKVYITDRCWNDFPGGGRKVGGAVLIYDPNPSEPSSQEVEAGASLERGGPFASDVNGDGRVDILDLAFIGERLGSDDPLADVNGDGVVDVADMSFVASNYERR